MRTTLDIDDSVLAVARALAVDSGTSIGAALSLLARRGITSDRSTPGSGFPTFRPADDATPITMQVVNAHRDE